VCGGPCSLWPTGLCPPPGSSFESGCELSEAQQRLLQKAAELHAEHLQVADEGGQFVAHVNLGLCFGELRDFATAANHHQEALKVAISLQVTVMLFTAAPVNTAARGSACAGA
jgi:hypothetical protein